MNSRNAHSDHACFCEELKADPNEVVSILGKHGGDPTALLSILGDIQARYRCLPEEALRLVAGKTGRSLVDIYGVATFYRSFSLEPKGKHLICVCKGTACHVRGSAAIAEEFEQQLGVAAGETTADREFTLETANCLGACALGPVVVVDGQYFSKTRRTQVRELIEEARKPEETDEYSRDPRNFPVELLCHVCGASLMDERYLLDGYPSVRLSLALNGKRTTVRLSSLYGSPHSHCERDLPERAVVSLSCPHCGTELDTANECPDCHAPMVPLSVKGGGTLYICSRKGCKSHLLDLVDTIGWGGVPPVVITR